MVAPLISTQAVAPINIAGSPAAYTGTNAIVGIVYDVFEVGSGDGVLTPGERLEAIRAENFRTFDIDFLGWYNDADGLVLFVENEGKTYAMGSTGALSALSTKAPLQFNASALDPNTIPCYLSGTLIRTHRGEVAVEDLQQGDMLETLTGEFAPLRWIGTRQVHERRAAVSPQKTLPIRFAQGALGNGLPARDLWVSPDHCMYHEGALVKAQTLVNGTTVAQMHPLRPITYYHLLLDRHEVIFAEGAASESYRPCGNVMGFANAGDFPADVEKNQPKSARRFPVRASGPAVEEMRARISAEAERLMPATMALSA